MTRTQLSFERETLKSAKRRAADLGVSLAEYVRRLVEADLDRSAPSGDPASVFDLGRSGGTDIAAGKGPLLGEAMSEGHR